MGMFEQTFRDQEAPPLGGKLAEIEAVLDSVREQNGRGEREALRRIAQILNRFAPGETYQKPLG